MSTLVFADEVVPAASVDELAGLSDVRVADSEVEMAEMLVESLTDTFDPAEYTDEYRLQVLDLLGKKATGEELELPAAAAAEAPNVVGLMAALEATVEAAKAARDRHPTARPAPKAGAKKPAKRAAKPRVRKTA